MRVHLMLAVLLVGTAGSAGAALELREAWRFPAGAKIADPTLLRHTEGGPIEGIVFTAADGRLVCLDGGGKVAWTQPIARLSHTAPSVGDVDGDGENEVIALDADGVLHCLSTEGGVEWTAQLPAGTRDQNGAGLFDLDGDGAREIVVGDGAGRIWCFDGRGGARWTVDVGRRWFGMPTFADLDGDGRPEIVIGEVDHHLYCLNSEGEWLWEIWRQDEVFGNSGCTVADLTGDGVPEVLVGGGLNHFFALDGRTGTRLREINTRQHINSAMVSADLEGDGLTDVVFGTRSGEVYRIGREGEVVWMRNFKIPIMTAPALADLTGDGRAEVVVLIGGEALVVLDAGGEEVARVPLSGGSAVAPAVGDVDGDGQLEILAPDKGEAELVCLETGAAARPGAVAWESMRGDAACTGNPRGVGATRPAPIRRRAAGGAGFEVSEEIPWLCGANERVYSLSNPDSWRLVLAFSVEKPGGVVERAFRHVKRPSARAKCGVFVDETGRYRVSTRLLNVDTRSLLQEDSSTQAVDLFARDVEQSQRTVDALDATIAALAGAPADVGEYLRWAQLHMEGHMQGLRSARGKPLPPAEKGRLIEEAMSSRRRAGHLLRLAGFVRSRPEAERGRAFAVWPGFPWHRFQAASAAPPAESSTGIELEAYLGERESACVNITNFRGRAAAYRVEMGEVKHVESGEAMPDACFELREAVEAPSTSRYMVADALVPLNDADAAVVGPWESRQVWVTLAARDVEPGEYAGTLAVTSVEPFPTSEEVEVRVRVWPIEIPSPGAMRFCNWSASPRGKGAFIESFVRQVSEHGVNVITVGAPGARFDAQGNLVEPINYASRDAAVQAYPEATFLCSSPQHSIRVEGAEMFSEKWIACYRKYLAAWVEHMEGLGLGTDRFLLYPVDEASIAGSPHLIELTDTARITKEIDPRVQVFANPSMGATVEGLTELSRYVDVWCPSQELMDREGVPLLDFFKRTGREVWFYDARGESRTLSGIAFFRRQAWQAWHFGLDGMGFYAAMARPGHAWRGPTPEARAAYFDAIYSGRRAIASKRYEGSRDGKEDFEAMVLLRQAVEAAKAAGTAAAQVAQAERLLAEEAESIWQAMDALDDRCEVMTDGSEARQVVERVRAFRRQVAELTLALREPATE